MRALFLAARLATLALTAMSFTTLAFAFDAAGPMAFAGDAFARAQAEGRPILVEVGASSCPTCEAQQPILRELLARPAYKGVTVFRVDFEGQKDVLRQLRVSLQSTLIAYRGRAETARSFGDTTPAGIERLVASAVAGG